MRKYLWIRILAFASILAINAAPKVALAADPGPALARLRDRIGEVHTKFGLPDFIRLADSQRIHSDPALWRALQAVCKAGLGGSAPCPEEPEQMTPALMASLAQALLNSGRLAAEDLTGQRVCFVADSLVAGFEGGAAPPATAEPRLWARLRAAVFGNAPAGRVTAEDAYPYTPPKIDASFTALTTEAMSSLLAPGPATVTQPSALIRVFAIGGLTIHEAISEFAELLAEGWAGTAMPQLTAFQEELGGRSPLEYCARHLDQGNRGGVLVISLGANDLLTMGGHVVVGSPERTAEDIVKDLRTLAALTAPLHARGIRTIFVAPVDVTVLFRPFSLPRGSRYTDGAVIQPGATTLYSHWLAASRGAPLPRHVVLTPGELAELGRRARLVGSAARQLLGRGWTVVDPNPRFARLARQIVDKGFRVDNIDGEASLDFQGPESVFSVDAEHPGPVGQEVLAAVTLAAMADAGFRVQGVRMGATDAELLERVRRAVRSAPQDYRPETLSLFERPSPLHAPSVHKPGTYSWARHLLATCSFASGPDCRGLLLHLAARLSDDALSTLCSDFGCRLRSSAPYEAHLAALHRATDRMDPNALRAHIRRVGPWLREWLNKNEEQAKERVEYVRLVFCAISAGAPSNEGVTPSVFRPWPEVQVDLGGVGILAPAPRAAYGLDVNAAWGTNAIYLGSGVRLAFSGLVGLGLGWAGPITELSEIDLLMALGARFSLNTFPTWALAAEIGWRPVISPIPGSLNAEVGTSAVRLTWSPGRDAESEKNRGFTLGLGSTVDFDLGLRRAQVDLLVGWVW